MMDTVRAGGYHEGFPVARLPMQALQEPTSTGTVLDNVSITPAAGALLHSASEMLFALA